MMAGFENVGNYCFISAIGLVSIVWVAPVSVSPGNHLLLIHYELTSPARSSRDTQTVFFRNGMEHSCAAKIIMITLK